MNFRVIIFKRPLRLPHCSGCGFFKLQDLRFESSVIFNGTQTELTVSLNATLFESSVIFNGTQTDKSTFEVGYMFESSVIFNGTQTDGDYICNECLFESSVIFNGTQTFLAHGGIYGCLRVV